MLLHTILPLEEILRQPDETTYEYKESQHNFIQCVNCNGKYTISRLISTDPKLYLDPRFSPGEYYPDQ